MKLYCPKCSAQILSAHVNLEEGIAHCTQCDEYFKIASHLREDEEIRRIAKPHFSEIDLKKDLKSLTIYVPQAGWTGSGIFFLLFALCTTGIPLIIFEAKNQEGDKTTYIILFAIGTILFLLFLFFCFNKTTVHFDKETIFVKWQVLGISYTKRRNSQNLEKITEDVIYTKNYQPVYGIGLFFRDESKIKFGSDLKEEERKWIIGEFYEMKGKLLSRVLE